VSYAALRGSRRADVADEPGRAVGFRHMPIEIRYHLETFATDLARVLVNLIADVWIETEMRGVDVSLQS
jgi:hypothetical protein